MTSTLGRFGAVVGALACASGATLAQELVVVPEDAPHIVGPGTQGFVAYQGPAPVNPSFFWSCDTLGLPIGEVAEEVHLKQAGDLASFTFSYFTQGGPPSGGTVTATVRVYANDATDSVTPPAGLLATYVLSGLPHSSAGALFTQTHDVPVPVAVPQHLWFGVELTLPAGSIGSLAGARSPGGGNPAVPYGSSHNLTWFGPAPCVTAPGLLLDNGTSGFVGNYFVTVRVFPEDDCPDALPNGSFEDVALGPWTGTGDHASVTGFDAGTPPVQGGRQAGVSNAPSPFDPNPIHQSPLFSATASVPTAALETFLGVPSGTLAGLTVGGPVAEGSAIRQTIGVAAGDTLTFDWNFLTNELPGSPDFNDFGFLTLSSGGSLLVADTFTPFGFLAALQTDFNEATGYQAFAHTFASAGTVTLGLGVADREDDSVNSALLLDCVQLVPGAGSNEPPTCAADLTLAQASFLEVAPGSFVVTEGETIVVPFTGDDPDGDLLMVDVAGLPPGASIGPGSGNAPLLVTFQWTPGAADKAGAPYVVTVTFEDPSGATSSCEVTIADVNLRPVCSASSQTLECTSSAGALVTLDGSATDADDPDEDLLFTWFVSDNSVVLDDPTSPTASGQFPVGVTMATLSVADGRGGVCVHDVLITVQDSLPPEVMCTTSVAKLWPPNHHMRPVCVYITATDACADPGTILPIQVFASSDEPDNAFGSGDGNTCGDVHGHDGFAAPVNVTSAFTWDAVHERWKGTIFLRAERAGSGNGRKYRIDVTAFDSMGNAATTSCCVIVPHDRRHHGGCF